MLPIIALLQWAANRSARLRRCEPCRCAHVACKLHWQMHQVCVTGRRLAQYGPGLLATSPWATGPCA